MIFFEIYATRDIDGEPLNSFTLDAVPMSFLEEYINDVPPMDMFNPLLSLLNMKSGMLLTMRFPVLDTPGIDINAWLIQVFDALEKVGGDSVIVMGLANSGGNLYRMFLIDKLVEYNVDSSRNVHVKFSVVREVTHLMGGMGI